MRSMLAGVAETGSEAAQRLECKKNNPSVGLRRQLPLHKGFASVRSTLAGVAETGSETAQRLEGLFSTTHPPLPRSPPLSQERAY